MSNKPKKFKLKQKRIPESKAPANQIKSPIQSTIDLRKNTPKIQETKFILGQSAATMLYLLENYLKMPDNLFSLIIPKAETLRHTEDLAYINFLVNDFGALLIQLAGTLYVLNLRQNGNLDPEPEASITDFAQGLFFQSIQDALNPANVPKEQENPTLLVDERALFETLSYFIGIHQKKEAPELMCQIPRIVREFITKQSPMAREIESKKYAERILEYPDTPFEWAQACYGPATQEEITEVLNAQEEAANSMGKNYGPARTKILQIIDAYASANIMQPEIIFFRPHAIEAVSRKRKEFTDRIKKNFLKYMGTILKPIDRHTEDIVKNLREYGSFRQQPNVKGIYTLTCEHSYALLAGDNNVWQLCVVPRIVNHDMNKLNMTQVETLGLKRCQVTLQDGQYLPEQLGYTFYVITMRPTPEFFIRPWRVPQSVLYAPFRTPEELNQIKRGIIDPPRPQPF